MTEAVDVAFRAKADFRGSNRLRGGGFRGTAPRRFEVSTASYGAIEQARDDEQYDKQSGYMSKCCDKTKSPVGS